MKAVVTLAWQVVFLLLTVSATAFAQSTPQSGIGMVLLRGEGIDILQSSNRLSIPSSEGIDILRVGNAILVVPNSRPLDPTESGDSPRPVPAPSLSGIIGERINLFLDGAWQLDEFHVDEEATPVLNGTAITAIFKSRTVSGSGGCNAYRATFHTKNEDGGNFTAIDLMSTKMHCPEPPGANAQESRFFEYLLAATNYSVTGEKLDKLRISHRVDGKERALTFHKIKASRDRLSSPETKDWYSWIDKLPPKPNELHVIGDVKVANPGVDVQLSYRIPQGFNPNVLLLDLHLVQRPGSWPQVMTWKQTRYDRVLRDESYDKVQIFFNGEEIEVLKVDIVE